MTADRVGVGGAALDAVRVALTLAVASVSYTVVERPVRRGRSRAGRSAGRPPARSR